MQNRHRHFALVPAAGSGSRMGRETPKQYLPLLGEPLLQHTLRVLCRAPQIERVYVVLSVGDSAWDAAAAREAGVGFIGVHSPCSEFSAFPEAPVAASLAAALPHLRPS